MSVRRIIIVIAVVALLPSPAAAQKALTALEQATSMQRAGRPIAEVAKVLQSEYRQSGEMMVSTVARAGYRADDIALHLVRGERVSTGESAAWLTRAGVEPGITFRAVRTASGETVARIASSMKQSGASAADIAKAMKESGDVDDATIISTLAALGYTAVDVARVAALVLKITFNWQMVDAMLDHYEARGVGQAIAQAYPESTLPGQLAAQAKTLGVDLYLITDVLIGFGWDLASPAPVITASMVALALQALTGAGYSIDLVTASLAQHGVGHETAIGAMLQTGTFPIVLIAEIVATAWQRTPLVIAQALLGHGVPPVQVLPAVRQAHSLSADQLVTLFLELGLQSDFAALQQVLEVVAQDPAAKSLVKKLAEAGISATAIAKGLASGSSPDFNRIAIALAGAFPDATTILDALRSAGLVSPMAGAFALKAAGFGLAQAQPALLAAFTLTAQQLADIAAQVFGS